jgi:spore coat protein CotH
LRSESNYNLDISNSLLDLCSNNDWILDASYRDNSRIRALTSFEVWENIINEPKYSIHSKFVELFINNEHQGLYCLREKFNAESLRLLNSNSVIYKSISGLEGATKFETYSSKMSKTLLWDGWEQRYPNPERNLKWEPLKELRYLTAASDSAYFCSNVSSLVDIDEYINLYIFLYLSFAKDCICKNIFLIKENDGIFISLPWDLDPTWGLHWTGEHVSYCYLFSEHLFDRLIELNPDNFKERFKSRWWELRNDIITETKIKELLNTNFDLITTSGIIEIENDLWDTGIDIDDERNFIFTWLEQRIAFLDHYFENL